MKIREDGGNLFWVVFWIIVLVVFVLFIKAARKFVKWMKKPIKIHITVKSKK